MLIIVFASSYAILVILAISFVVAHVAQGLVLQWSFKVFLNRYYVFLILRCMNIIAHVWDVYYSLHQNDETHILGVS